MLKWAVNETVRQSYLKPSSIDTSNNNIQSTITPKSRKSNSHATTISTSTKPLSYNKRKSIHQSSHENLHRKSSSSSTTTSYSEMTNIKRKILKRDKENNLTSTPLPLSTLNHHNLTISPLRKLHSLKDLSNITISPSTSSSSSLLLLNSFHTPKNQISIINNDDDNKPNHTTTKNNNPLQYSTTLPTFDVEYSPSCNTTTPIPGPILALRGIGIADSYFDKPRYLNDDQIKNSTTETIKTKIIRKSHHNSLISSNSNNIQDYTENCNKIDNNNESLSSSRMDDTTLDKMIDAILESARKEKRLTKFRYTSSTNHHQLSMSPTYTPADDPANDLNETWDSKNEKYLQKDFFERKRRKLNYTSNINEKNYNEREVKTPEDLCNENQNLQENINHIPSSSSLSSPSSCHLKRQKAVRRKRKLSSLTTNNFIKNSIKNSTHKLLSSSSSSSTITNNRRKSIDELAAMETPKGRNYNNNNNISPDSGRNSPIDFDIESLSSLSSNNASNLNLTIKKRLSFSSSFIKTKSLGFEKITSSSNNNKDTIT